MTDTSKIEENLRSALNCQFGKEQGGVYFARYITAKERLVADIYKEIKGVEQSLTDHDATHAYDVLDKINSLLSDDIKQLTGCELYCLYLSALFHDTGNIHGRKEHQKKLSDIHDHIRDNNSDYRQEKSIVLNICGAHCGKSPDGTNDTLKHIDPNNHLFSKPIRQLCLAAILRLADELAEGRIRTSLYMQKTHGYKDDSMIFHRYAGATEIFVDKGNGRIAITYHLEITTIDGVITDKEEVQFKEVLRYIYTRIIKLDQERRYARYYCDFLLPFKTTSISFIFWIDGQKADVNITPLILSDLVVPDDSCTPIDTLYPDYNVDVLIGKIKTSIVQVQKTLEDKIG